MTLTCIINQFDCNAGINGAIFCISVGRLKRAKEFINKVVGDKMAPTKWLFVDLSRIIWIRLKLHDRKIKDSYNQVYLTNRTVQALLNAYGSNFLGFDN